MKFIYDFVHLILAAWIALVNNSTFKSLLVASWIPHPKGLGRLSRSQGPGVASGILQDPKHHFGVGGRGVVDESRINASFLKEGRVQRESFTDGIIARLSQLTTKIFVAIGVPGATMPSDHRILQNMSFFGGDKYVICTS